jgi:hypothetical protein
MSNNRFEGVAGIEKKRVVQSVLCSNQQHQRHRDGEYANELVVVGRCQLKINLIDDQALFEP